MRRAFSIVVLVCLWSAERAHAQEEIVTDVRVQNATRTDEATVRSIAGIDIGDVLRSDTLDTVRERLHSSGLFASVNVYWEPHREGVRINIVITEKIPWAPLPTFSYSPGNISAGGFLGHGNLFGRGKRGLIGGRISNVDSGGIAVYEDPAVLGSWGFFNLRGKYHSQSIPEYSNTRLPDMPLLPMRDTKLRTYGFEVSVGVAWFRRIRTSVGWLVDRNEVVSSDAVSDNPYSVQAFAGGPPPPATVSARRGSATANLTFDFRAREHAIMYGNALSFYLEYAAKRWGSEESIRYWKASAGYQHGLRFFRRHNLIVRLGATVGDNLPLWSENSAGGTNLRGYLYRQFQGDTHLLTQVEYHFPLFSLWGLDVRGLLFSDAAAIWYRKLPETDPTGTAYARRNDGRQFLSPIYLRQGFDAAEDIHSSAGAGLRFYLRSIAIPLVGIDVGNGLGTKDIRLILVLGV